jgi:hypothetical protein
LGKSKNTHKAKLANWGLLRCECASPSRYFNLAYERLTVGCVTIAIYLLPGLAFDFWRPLTSDGLSLGGFITLAVAKAAANAQSLFASCHYLDA